MKKLGYVVDMEMKPMWDDEGTIEVTLFKTKSRANRFIKSVNSIRRKYKKPKLELKAIPVYADAKALF